MNKHVVPSSDSLLEVIHIHNMGNFFVTQANFFLKIYIGVCNTQRQIMPARHQSQKNIFQEGTYITPCVRVIRYSYKVGVIFAKAL